MRTRASARFYRLSLHGTRLAGLGLLGTGLWSIYEQPSAQLIWGGVMTLSGIGLVLHRARATREAVDAQERRASAFATISAS